MGVHFVAVPFPAQGHLTPMMRLCKALAKEGALVTFVEPDAIHLRIQETQLQLPAHVDGSQTQAPDRQPTIPAQTDNGDDHAAAAHTPDDHQHLPAASLGQFKFNLRRVQLPMEGLDLSKGFPTSLQGNLESVDSMAPHLRHLLIQLSESPTPVTCIISDICITLLTQTLADELRIPCAVLLPCCQGMLLFNHHLLTHPTLTMDHAAQIVSQQRLSSEVVAEGLEGLPSVIRAEDLPVFRHLVEESQYAYGFFKRVFSKAFENAHSILVNSFDELDGSALKALAARVKAPIYAVGPLLELLADDSTTSLWKEDEACMLWLDRQPPHSVLYISFGSITLLSQAQFEEFVHGLLASRQRFIWVARPNSVLGDAERGSRLLEEGVREGRGCVVSWAPQMQVLAHSSTGGFLTQCGWNSVTEAMCQGVPMLCWPYFAEHFLVAKYIVEEWRIGSRFARPNGQVLVDRSEVERCIRAVMQSGEGECLRQHARTLKEACLQALSPVGSSLRNLQSWLKSMGN